MKHLIEKFMSLPKSLYVSMKFLFFPILQALRIPILVRYDTKLTILSGTVNFNSGGGKNRNVDHWLWTSWYCG